MTYEEKKAIILKNGRKTIEYLKKINESADEHDKLDINDQEKDWFSNDPEIIAISNEIDYLSKLGLY